MRRLIPGAVVCIPLVFFTAGLSLAEDGATNYIESCAMCHDGGSDRAPSREALRQMSPDRVLAALESGPMISMANRRSPAERRALAEFVTGKSFAQPLGTTPAPKGLCTGGPCNFANQLAGA